MSKISNTLPILIVVLLSCGCAEKISDAYAEIRATEGVESWLLSICEPEKWCAPYAYKSASDCVAEHFDFKTLGTLTGKRREKFADDSLWSAQVCALEKVNKLYQESQGPDI